jgi:hypothetical protein
MANVGRDAGAVDDRAAEVRSAIGNVAASLSSLRSTLVKVVRTTTTEANRRQWPRVKANRPVKITSPGIGRLDATLVDISEGGAWIRAQHSLEIGASGTMHLDGFAHDLPFTVRAREQGALHVEFDLGRHRLAYQAWFETNFDQQAA